MYSISNIEKTENLIIQVSQLKHRVDNLENILRNGKDVLTLEEASLYTGISAQRKISGGCKKIMSIFAAWI